MAWYLVKHRDNFTVVVVVVVVVVIIIIIIIIIVIVVAPFYFCHFLRTVSVYVKFVGHNLNVSHCH